MKDGHLNKCKKCTKEDNRKNREKNIDKCRKYDNDRYKNDIKRRELGAENCRRQRKLYPEKYKARALVATAIKSGRLIKMPCCVCGSEKSMGHHEDYSKPLEVIWVCAIHHYQLEKK
jgi:hypothetical protein